MNIVSVSLVKKYVVFWIICVTNKSTGIRTYSVQTGDLKMSFDLTGLFDLHVEKREDLQMDMMFRKFIIIDGKYTLQM